MTTTTEYDPYNPNNVLITERDIEDILKKYNIFPVVHNITLYRRAFVHDSYVRKSVEQNIAKARPTDGDCLEPATAAASSSASASASAAEYESVAATIKPPRTGEIPLANKSNQRLEFLGDGILEAVAKFWIYRNFPKASEGFMTDMKINLVKNEAIGRIALEMGLNKWMLLEKSLESKLRNDKPKMGCLFEAFVGALFLDMNHLAVTDEEGWFDSGMFLVGPGFQVVQLFLERVFDRHVDRVRLITENTNHKRTLQEKIQSLFKTTPVYVMEAQPVRVGVNGYDSDTYKMGAYLCLGVDPHGLSRKDSTSVWALKDGIESATKGFFFLGEGEHRVKKEAEQAACKMALDYWSLAASQKLC